MPKVTQISSRKADHIRINLEKDVRSSLTTGLERYRFIHRAVPEINLEDINISMSLFGRQLKAPLLISSMTGGTKEAERINRTLAMAAQKAQIALGVGSQRVAIEHPEFKTTFNIRKEAPDVLVFANLGAVQLNYGYGMQQCIQAIDMVEADALILHFNPLQEALQTNGQTRFEGLLNKIEELCLQLPVPVIAKEVGWGFSEQDVKALSGVGVVAIDVAGAGGTSWSQVEMHRANAPLQKRLATSFLDWGIPTAEAILNVKRVNPEMILFASGGVYSGVDIAKCIALGATLAGMAGPFLKTAVHSFEDTYNLIKEVCQEIKVCMFAAGVVDLAGLAQLDLIL
jgi:isopentenyl-diphosphate Delta-isomerase